MWIIQGNLFVHFLSIQFLLILLRNRHFMTKEKKNILLIIPNIGFGGAQRSFINLYHLLKDHYQVYLVAFNLDAEIPEMPRDIFLSLEVPEGNSLLNKVVLFFRRIKKLKKIKRQLKVFASISFMEGANYVNILSREHDSVIISIRGSERESIKKNYDNWLGMVRRKFFIPILYNKADKIVGVSGGIQHELVNYFSVERPFALIPNYINAHGIAQQAAQDIPATYQPIFERPVIISVGRLALQKRVDHLIEVYARVKKEFPTAKLVLVGDGELHDELVQQCIELGLKHYTFKEEKTHSLDLDVYFLGYQKNPAPYVRNAKVFTLTSDFEGFPNALFEALACNVPCLTVDCPYGPREILDIPLLEQVNYPVKKHNGILLPLFDGSSDVYEIWKEQIIKQLNNGLGFNQKELEDSLERFSKPRIKQRWIETIG